MDLPRVVPCMPGTELTARVDENRFEATARLRVGPIELLFKGEGELYDLDSVTHAAKLRARGSDTKGRGSFQTQMVFTLAPQDPATVVRVESDLTLSGSVAQHARGSGVVKEIAQQLTDRFAKNLAGVIAAEHTPSDASSPSGTAIPQPTRAPAISGFALLFGALKAILRRWFSARS